SDYQIADLGKPHMRGPMWSSGTSVAEREGSRIEGLRPQHRPYRADADMTAVVELCAESPVNIEQLMPALDQPVHPLFVGRSSCPPATKIAGHVFDAPSLEAAVSEVAQIIGARFICPPRPQQRHGAIFPCPSPDAVTGQAIVMPVLTSTSCASARR